MALNFEKYTQEANAYINNLSKNLGHPDDITQTEIILKSVLHTLRDSITVSESLDLIAQLPMFIKAIYVDNWSFRVKPIRVNSLEDFTEEVKKRQSIFGESNFDWKLSTEEIVEITLSSLDEYLTEGQKDHIVAQMPENMKEFFKKSMYA